jgi:signal transduction histidine kinase
VPVGDVLPFWLWIAGAYGIGTALRRRESLAALLEDRAVRAERERELRAREAIVEERGRIARELHDVVAHNVSVMVIQAQGAGRVLEGDQPQVRTALEAIETTGREAVDEMRRLLGVLRAGDAAPAAALAPRPGLAQLDALLDSVRAAGVRVDLDVEGRPVTLPPGIDVSAYRIVQEALTNTLRHADARHAAVVVRYAPQAVELEVRDDGRAGAGRAAGNGGGGHGLVGMRERTALFGGELSAGRQNGGGWTVRARLPVDGAATRP